MTYISLIRADTLVFGVQKCATVGDSSLERQTFRNDCKEEQKRSGKMRLSTSAQLANNDWKRASLRRTG